MAQRAKPGIYGDQPLRELLRERGLTHAEAAEAVGISTHMVTQLCAGSTRASLQTAAKLVRLLGAPIEEVFSPSMLYGEDAPKVKPPRKRR